MSIVWLKFLNFLILLIYTGSVFYKQIIDDFVISKHEVNFTQLYKRDISIPQVFERYGKKIENIDYKYDFFRDVMMMMAHRSLMGRCFL